MCSVQLCCEAGATFCMCVECMSEHDSAHGDTVGSPLLSQGRSRPATATGSEPASPVSQATNSETLLVPEFKREQELMQEQLAELRRLRSLREEQLARLRADLERPLHDEACLPAAANTEPAREPSEPRVGFA